MSEPASDAPSAVIFTDGKIGDLVQCRGVAEAMGLAARETVVRLRRPWAWFAPRLGVDPAGKTLAQEARESDIVIASGRRAAPMLRAVKKASNGRAFTILLKDGRGGTGLADFIWVPEHDPLRGPNVMTTLTSPHGLSAARIEVERAALPADIATLPRPIATVLLGGPSGRNTFSTANVEALCDGLKVLSTEIGAMLITPSRRTPPALLAAVTMALSSAPCPVRVWNRTDPNPYLRWMAAADLLVVTGDSVNMVGEAAAMGRPVLVHRPDTLSPKIAGFLDRMEEAGVSVRLGADWTLEPRAPLDATTDIAGEALARFAAHRQSKDA